MILLPTIIVVCHANPLTPIDIVPQETIVVNYISNVELKESKLIVPIKILSRFETKIPVIETKKPINIEKVLLMGNSLTVGMDIVDEDKYSIIAEIGATITSTRKSGRYEEIQNCDFETVVISFGTNELGYWSLDDWRYEFEILINKIYEVNPNADIVIVSPPPVSADKSDDGDRYNNDNVKICTEYLMQVAQEFEVYFINSTELFGDVLQNDVTEDGIHFVFSWYKKWLDFIIKKLENM